MKCYRNKKGFTLVEVMIVVAIIGILATVTIPIYMSYIQKSRIRVLVYPGLHSIETNISLYYAKTTSLPDPSLLPEMMEEADTTFFNVGISGDDLVITIDSPESNSKLSRMHGYTMYLTPDTHDLKISTWTLRGTLANYLGINTAAP
jgi:prepilin-type N-terminal cleavage/methylation domain-containing protein